MMLPLSESHTFNKLESIAMSPRPTTPVLGCRIVKALELNHVGNKVQYMRPEYVTQPDLHSRIKCMCVADVGGPKVFTSVVHRTMGQSNSFRSVHVVQYSMYAYCISVNLIIVGLER